MNKQTLAINNPFPHTDAYGALSMPVYHSCAYEFKTAQEMTDVFTGKVLEPDYSRVMNPTVTFFENKVKVLTDADNVFAFNSGMAAISNVLLSVTAAGKNIVSSKHLFGNTYSLINSSLRRFGVEGRFTDLTDLEATEQCIDENTACIYLEIITNPQMEVADLKCLSELAHRHGIPLIADTTMIPFTEFSAKGLGVDVEVVSSTKYISGGATSLGGLAIDYGTFSEVNKHLRFEMLFHFGAYMTPHAAYMQTLGLETLKARYSLQSSNALMLAKRLQKIADDGGFIRRVNYPALPSNPYYERSQQQFGTTGGAMITIDLESEQACYDFINRLQLIHRATNLFDNRTLAIHPYSTIFGTFTPEEKASMDVLPTTIRISVGLEAVDDLLDDIMGSSVC